MAEILATYRDESEPAQNELLGNGDGQNIEEQTKGPGNDSRQPQVVSRMAFHQTKKTRILRTRHQV